MNASICWQTVVPCCRSPQQLDLQLGNALELAVSRKSLRDGFSGRCVCGHNAIVEAGQAADSQRQIGMFGSKGYQLMEIIVGEE
jgi:hypothetical protein